jgi:glycosyltransferase involved in cell wall biosynthesis
MANQPFVSIVIPCRQEAGWIEPCLESIVQSDYPKDCLEVLVVDGMSDDGTRDMVVRFAERHPFIRLLDNPRKITPAALNVGITNARGAVIMRMDAHAEYPANYVSSLVRSLHESGADNVGGLWITEPGGKTALARAIAVGSSHPLGVGNAYYRIGASEPRWVDTVPFGCYRREVFDRIGLFDEQLVRNQDDEFNLRLIKHGGRILLTPQVSCRYFARDSLGKMCRMFYQYGYFKPLVVRKVGGVMTLRQLVPPLFVLSLIFTGALALWVSWLAVAFGLILASYALAIGLCAASQVAKCGGRCALWLCVVLPAMHFAYGLGYLKGFFDFILRRKGIDADGASIPVTR